MDAASTHCVIAMANLTKLTVKKREQFCETLRETGNISAAARTIGISRTAVYNLRETDPNFKAAWDEAHEEGLDNLEEEILRRAKKGTERPVFYQGEQCGIIQEYSDTLAMFILKAGRPEKYTERTRQEISGSLTYNKHVSELSDDELAAEYTRLNPTKTDRPGD